MNLPKFITPEVALAKGLDHPSYFVPRQLIQVLRFNFPKLSATELVQAVAFKLRATYPGHIDQMKYTIHWQAQSNGYLAFVVVFDHKDFDFYSGLISKNQLYPSFPYQLPPTLGRDVFLIYEHQNSYELFVYTRGILNQSHVVTLGIDDFGQLVTKLLGEHPNHKLIRIRQNQQELPWQGPVLDRTVTIEDIFNPHFFPAFTLKLSPPKSWTLLAFRIAMGLLVVGLGVFYLAQGWSRQDQKISELNQEIARLYETAGGNNGLREKVEAMELRLKDLKKAKGEPLWELSVLIFRLLGSEVTLTAMDLRDGKFHLEGVAQDGIKTLEKLRANPVFKTLTPVGIRIQKGTGLESFIFEGKISYDN